MAKKKRWKAASEQRLTMTARLKGRGRLKDASRVAKRILDAAREKTVKMRTDLRGEYWQVMLGGIWMEPVWGIEGGAKRSGNDWAERMGLKPEWE